jgi:hypothetical protein
MGIFKRSIWVNALGLLPGTLVTVLAIAVAFLRFYDTQDFALLGFIAQPRLWSNRFTVAALLATLANFGVEWNRRNREANRLAEEAQRSAEEEQRSAEEEQRRIREENRRNQEAERAASRARIQNRWIVLQIRHLLDPGEETQAAIADFLQFLQEYGEL